MSYYIYDLSSMHKDSVPTSMRKAALGAVQVNPLRIRLGFIFRSLL